MKHIWTKLGNKNRRPQRGPVSWRGQFSLAALVALTTVACIALTVWHYRGPQIVDGAIAHNRAHARAMPYAHADEMVQVSAILVSGLFGLAAGMLVFFMKTERGMYAVGFLTCVAFIGFVLAFNLQVRPLEETQLRFLRTSKSFLPPYSGSAPSFRWDRLSVGTPSLLHSPARVCG